MGGGVAIGEDEVRGDFGEGDQHKLPLHHLRMGHLQLGRINELVAEEQNVNINITRPPALPAHPPHFLLYLLDYF